MFPAAHRFIRRRFGGGLLLALLAVPCDLLACAHGAAPAAPATAAAPAPPSPRRESILVRPVAVTASSVESNRPELRPDNACDANPITRWASEKSDAEWLVLDFGKPVDFNAVTIAWEAAFGRRYALQTSNDGVNWTTIFQEKDGDGGEDSIALAPQKARHLRLLGQKRGTDWGYSIFELQVKNAGSDDGRPPASPGAPEAVFADGAVFLEWNDCPVADFGHYQLYRAEGEGAFAPLNQEPLLDRRFIDRTVKNGVTYRYYVTAVDIFDRASLPSPSVTGTPSSGTARDFLPVPSCAWKRHLGDLPAHCISSSPNRGVALGGFGAGSFMYTFTGAFGPFQTFDNTLYKGTWLPQAAFHVFEQMEGQTSNARCLATDAQLKPAWPKLRTGEGVYHALQPKGWVTYDTFRCDISQVFFTPIVPHDYRLSSLPVGIWRFRLHNPQPRALTVSVMLTFPGVYVGETLSEKRFSNSAVTGNGIAGIVLRSQGGLGEWCIATRAESGCEISRATSWNGDGDGGDVWAQFSDDGVLPDRALDGSMSAAALAVRVRLQAGETREIPFVISWDFPWMRFLSGTEWWKHYTEDYGRSGRNGARLAADALRQDREWEARVDAWMDPVVGNPRYPDWLKCAAFNELYYNQFGGIFFEAGLKAGHDHEYLGLHEEDHKHFEMESPIYTSANTLDVRHYGSIVYARFWPEIERDTLKCFADATLHYKFPKPVPVGLVPHDVGDPKKCDPYFEWDVYRHDIPDLVYWKDLSPKFVQQCWRYYSLHHDRKFLEYVWPACKAAYTFLKSTDGDNDQLPDNSGSDNTYDNWGLHGTSLLCGGLWVGALEALEKMAAVLKDPLLREIREQLAMARVHLDRELWLDDKRYYRIDTKSNHPTAIMSDGLNGQLYCRYGLADILPAERMREHLRQTFARCVKPFTDFTGDGVGDIGAVNCVKEDGGLIGTLQSDEVWTGATYALAALMYRAGLREEALHTAYGVYYNTYVNPATAFWFNTPESWRVGSMVARPSGPEQYQRPRAVWELLLAIDDPYDTNAARREN